eukprot:SAG31_NODE_39873_length_285_cov_0.510753_1_plen_31_part_10
MSLNSRLFQVKRPGRRDNGNSERSVTIIIKC